MDAPGQEGTSTPFPCGRLTVVITINIPFLFLGKGVLPLCCFLLGVGGSPRGGVRLAGRPAARTPPAPPLTCRPALHAAGCPRRRSCLAAAERAPAPVLAAPAFSLGRPALQATWTDSGTPLHVDSGELAALPASPCSPPRSSALPMAALVLEDGSVLRGQPFGAAVSTAGEVGKQARADFHRPHIPF